MVQITVLTSVDLNDHMLDSFERYQETKNVMVYESNNLTEKEDPFLDDWTIERKREIVNHFRSTIDCGGAVIVAKHEKEVVGFAVIEPESFGETSVYRELSYIHTSFPFRGMGIGRSLFIKTKEVAKQLGATKLYIGAHPSVATQRFYANMGCVLAEEINHDIYQREIRDIQLEISVC